MSGIKMTDSRLADVLLGGEGLTVSAHFLVLFRDDAEMSDTGQH
jgi:hypothetical protein